MLKSSRASEYIAVYDQYSPKIHGEKRGEFHRTRAFDSLGFRLERGFPRWVPHQGYQRARRLGPPRVSSIERSAKTTKSGEKKLNVLDVLSIVRVLSRTVKTCFEKLRNELKIARKAQYQILSAIRPHSQSSRLSRHLSRCLGCIATVEAGTGLRCGARLRQSEFSFSGVRPTIFFRYSAHVHLQCCRVIHLKRNNTYENMCLSCLKKIQYYI